MTRNRSLSTVKCLIIGFLAFVALGFIGCSGNRFLKSDGLPGDGYVVGGGMVIDWEAPTDGTAYLVEKTTGKVVETRSLAKGDHFDFSLATAGLQLEAFEHAIGIDFSEARLLLYFKPDAKKGSTR